MILKPKEVSFENGWLVVEGEELWAGYREKDLVRWKFLPQKRDILHLRLYFKGHGSDGTSIRIEFESSQQANGWVSSFLLGALTVRAEPIPPEAYKRG